MTLNEAMAKAEKEYITKLYAKYEKEGYAYMARIAGVSRKQIISKLYRYGLIPSLHDSINGAAHRYARV
jgi:DNA-binding NtrC family response regulator